MLSDIERGLKPNFRGGERAGLREANGEGAPRACPASAAAGGQRGSEGRAALVGRENAARRVALKVLAGQPSLRGPAGERPEPEQLIVINIYGNWRPKF